MVITKNDLVALRGKANALRLTVVQSKTKFNHFFLEDTDGEAVMAGTLETVNAFLTGAAWQRWR